MLGEDEMRDTVVLVLANKQDLPNAISTSDVIGRLALGTLGGGRHWHVQGTCATTGDGLFDGLDWLTATLMKTGGK